MSNQQTWFQNLVGTDNKSTAAHKADIPNSTLTFQLRNDSLAATTVIALARAYDRPVIKALAETGVISSEEATTLPVRDALQIAKDADLIAELARRLPAIDQDSLNTPLGDLMDIPGVDESNVIQFPPESTDAAGDEQAGSAQDTPAVQDENYRELLHASAHEYNPETGEYEEVMPKDAVANDRPEEGGPPDNFEP